MRRFFSLLLALPILFSLVGCNASKDETPPSDALGRRVPLAYVYTAELLSLPNGDTAGSTTPVFSRDGLSLYGKNSSQLVQYDADGTRVQNLSAAGLSIHWLAPFGDGYAVFGTSTDDKKLYRLAVVEADGTITTQLDLEDAALWDIIGAAGGDIFYISSSTGTLTVYNASLRVQKNIAAAL